MSSVPERPSIPLLRVPRWAWIFICSATAMTVVSPIVAALVLNLAHVFILICIASMLTATAVFVVTCRMDGAAHPSKVRPQLEAVGFEMLEPGTANPEFYEAVEQISHLADPNSSTERFLATSSFAGRQVFASTYRVGHGRQHLPILIVGVQTAHRWATATVRRRVIADKLRKRVRLDLRAFDQQRVTDTESPALAATQLRPIADWFITQDHTKGTLKLRESPGKHEQWALRGHWAVRAEFGRAATEEILETVKFMIAFAEASEDANLKS